MMAKNITANITARIVLFLIILFSFSASAQLTPYHLKLLAVQETEDGYQGSGADLFLELNEGSGRVFLETTPVTKMDTQISTRFAKEIACHHFKLDCEQYDFIFTIKADSNIIGGPSAGAAIAALTTIAVLDLKYREDIAITGTINSGGILGPVGGLEEKIKAAADAGVKKVLIASGSEMLTKDEQTLDLRRYGQEQGLEIIPLVDLDEVLLELTGVDLNHQEVEIMQDKTYQDLMQRLQGILCARTEKIEEEMRERGLRPTKEVSEAVEKRKSEAVNASSRSNYYSAASFCFGNNVQLKSYYYEQEELSPAQKSSLIQSLQQKMAQLEQELSLEGINTIADLQTLLIVQERLQDVREQLQRLSESTPDEEAGIIAYAEERFFSALSWKQFFAMDGKKFEMDEEVLRQSCEKKIAEAEERYQYTGIFLGEPAIISVQEKIHTAEESLKKKEYGLCLMEAAQAKADANAILSSIGLEQDTLAPFLESKQKAVERVIAENSADGIFPILGYSYYQYARSLKAQDPFTVLVYFEYALEMSDLGIYFPEEKSILEKSDLQRIGKEWWYAAGGLLLGLAAGGFLAGLLASKKKRNRKTKTRGRE